MDPRFSEQLADSASLDCEIRRKTKRHLLHVLGADDPLRYPADLARLSKIIHSNAESTLSGALPGN